MKRPPARLVLAMAILCLAPHRSARGQMMGLGTCRTKTSFSIPEGATRRVDLPDAYLSVFAEEIKDGSDDSHFYVAISHWPLAGPAEVLKKSAFEQRLKNDRIGNAKSRVLGARAYTILDLRSGRVESLQVPTGTLRLMVSNPRKHRLADVVLCLP